MTTDVHVESPTLADGAVWLSVAACSSVLSAAHRTLHGGEMTAWILKVAARVPGHARSSSLRPLAAPVLGSLSSASLRPPLSYSYREYLAR